MEQTTKRIEHLEDCDCKKSCSLNLVNGTVIKEDGEKWDIGCEECKCKRGEVTCSQRQCGKVECKHPIYEEGACCPKCLSTFI